MNISRFALGLLLTASAALPVDSSLLLFAEKDPQAVAGVYVDRSLTSPMGQYVLGRIQNDPKLKQFIADTGFDPRRDLREILISVPAPSAASTQNSHAALVAARGVFNGPQLIQEARSNGATTEQYKDVQILKLKGGFMCAAFLSNGITLLAPETTLKAALDRRSGPVILNAKSLAKLSQVSTGNDAWFVTGAPTAGMVPGGGTNPSTNPSAPKVNVQALQSIEQTSGGVKFGNLVEFSGEAATRSEKDAQALADVVRFMIGLAQMQTGKQAKHPDFLKLLQDVNISTSAATVTLNFSVPQADLEKLSPAASTAARAR